MARFTPWLGGAPVEPVEAGPLIEEVLRPSLQLAFPLPSEADISDVRFHRLLEALAQRHGQVTGR